MNSHPKAEREESINDQSCQRPSPVQGQNGHSHIAIFSFFSPPQRQPWTRITTAQKKTWRFTTVFLVCTEIIVQKLMTRNESKNFITRQVLSPLTCFSYVSVWVLRTGWLHTDQTMVWIWWSFEFALVNAALVPIFAARILHLSFQMLSADFHYKSSAKYYIQLH